MSNHADRRVSKPAFLRASWVAVRFSALIYIALTISACEHTGLMKTPNLYLIDSIDPFATLPPEQQKTTVDLFYATDRAPLEDPEITKGTGVQYGHHRSDSLAFGKTTVALGEQVTWEDLHEASLTRRRNRRFVPALVHTEEHTRFARAQDAWIHTRGKRLEINAPATEQSRAAAAVIAGEFETALNDCDRREVFLFIHGYNNQFHHAALTMSQLWHFMGRPGVPVIYSWPAGRGGLRGYTSDTESSEFTIHHLKQFLLALVETPNLEKIHILAHSRGTDVATTAIRELMLSYNAAGLDARGELKLGNLVLAAPDLDVDIVKQTLIAEGMVGVPERFTIYISPKDRALLISSWLMDSVKRLGNLGGDQLNAEEEATITEMSFLTFINTDVKSDITGHAYFWTNPAASSDLILLLRDDLDPGIDHGRPLISKTKNYWILRDHYLLDASERPEAP